MCNSSKFADETLDLTSLRATGHGRTQTDKPSTAVRANGLSPHVPRLLPPPPARASPDRAPRAHLRRRQVPRDSRASPPLAAARSLCAAASTPPARAAVLRSPSRARAGRRRPRRRQIRRGAGRIRRPDPPGPPPSSLRPSAAISGESRRCLGSRAKNSRSTVDP